MYTFSNKLQNKRKKMINIKMIMNHAKYFLDF